jgi:hypothetical protein
MSEREMAKLLELVRRHLGSGWLDLADWLADQNDLGDIEARIRSGDYTNAVGKIEQAALKWAADTQASYVQSGQRAALWLDEQPALKDKLVRFDSDSVHVIQRAQANRLEYVRGFADERNQITSQIVRRAMVEGAEGGVNPRRVAQDFRDSIGLTATQEQHVSNYRRELERGEWGAALGRELSDGRHDRAIRTAQRDGGRLTPAQIDSFTARYRDNYITYRAETVARTESQRNVHAGLDEAFTQAIQRGDVDAATLVKTWHAGPYTANARPNHQRMNDKTAKHGEAFVMPDGTQMMFPGDDAGGVANVANCRCTFSTTFV